MAEYTYNLTNTTAQMEQLRKNNLNPTLALGKGTGGQTVSTGNASTGSVGMIDNKMSLADAQNMALLEAQRKNISFHQNGSLSRRNQNRRFNPNPDR